jgi:hypothetical protein
MEAVSVRTTGLETLVNLTLEFATIAVISVLDQPCGIVSHLERTHP